MSRLSFTPTVENALRELDRLEGIKKSLSGLMVDLEPSLTNPSSAVWYNIYADRLETNVLPAIKEVKEYLQEQSLKVSVQCN